MNARIGGHVRGQYQRDLERRGGRVKGGCGLRDKLIAMSGKKKGTPRDTPKQKKSVPPKPPAKQKVSKQLKGKEGTSKRAARQARKNLK